MDKKLDLKTFTTRVDTIFAVTFIVIAPEHPLIMDLTVDTQRTEVLDYIQKTKAKSERQRQIGAEKTGVFTGSFVRHPLTGEELPIWVSDFVLPGYGTGAVMADAHDERDVEFAKKYNIPLKTTIALEKDVKDSESGFVESSFKEGEIPDKIITEDGVLYNSGEFDGLDSKTAREKISEKLEEMGRGEKQINYKFRDMVFSRQRYWGEPFPFEYIKVNTEEEPGKKYTEIDGQKYEIRLLDETQLPLRLPDIDNFEPSPDGKTPLGKSGWIYVKDENGQTIGLREQDTMPNWAGSSWYYLRFTDPKNTKDFASPENLKYWLPVDNYFGGSEHVTLHLLYSRFWHRFLYDYNLVPTEEPYDYRVNGGMLLGTDNTKMSKSKGNVITLSETLDRVGADSLRLYINFIGPYEGTVVWQEGGLVACKRLIDNIFGLSTKVDKDLSSSSNKKLLSAYHKMLKKITQQIETLKTNVAVAELMIFVNSMKEVEKLPGEIWSGFLQALAPFAPHTSEELWYEFHGFDQENALESIHLSKWPEYNPDLAIDDTVIIAVQINGKLRTTFEVAKDLPDTEVLKEAKESAEKWLEGKTLKFSKVVPNKLVSLVVAD